MWSVRTSMRCAIALIVVVLPATAYADHDHGAPGLAIGVSGGMPDGLGITTTSTPTAMLAVGLGVSTLGATVALSPEATLNTLPKAAWVPTVTLKMSTIIFTPLMDSIVKSELERIYGDQVSVDMAGRVMEVAELAVGIDHQTSRRGHLFLRAGYAWQLGGSLGHTSGDDLTLRDWHGPVVEVGMRWRMFP